MESALDLPEDQRESWLKTTLAEDPTLAHDAWSLVAASQASEGFLETSALDAWTAWIRGDEHARREDRFGPYRLLHPLGQGGMGMVFLGVRDDDAYEVRVAIKVASRVTTSAEAQRFRNERQILANLDHPNIARLLDGGTTSEGLPYLVMEYVKGTSVDAYCDREQLSIPARIDLFRTVCTAVAHAHANLVIHRDLKPSNILVTPDGVPKLLDFGIAKLLDPDAAGGTTLGPRALTPNYASPEQRRGQTVTTTTDVYSLGVILHQLTTGQLPRFRGGDTDAEAGITREPVLPSLLLDRGSTEQTREPLDLETIAARRRARLVDLRRILAGDLDTIMLEALRQDADQRYGSVVQLSDDLDRYRRGLPVQARKPTIAYQFGKLARRHRLAVGSTLAAVSLLLTLAASLARQTRVLADQRDEVQVALDRAQLESMKAREIADFMESLFDAGNPMTQHASPQTIRDVLDRGALRVGELASNPLVQADLQLAIGRAYVQTGDFDEAQDLLQQSLESRENALGGDHLEVAISLLELAKLDHRTGYFERAIDRLTRALEIEANTQSSDPLLVAGMMDLLGIVHHARFDFTQAEPWFRKALVLRETHLPADDAGLVPSLNHLAILLATAGDLDAAEPLFQRAHEKLRRALGPDHAMTIQALGNLGELHLKAGRFQEAELRIARAQAQWHDTGGYVMGEASYWALLGTIAHRTGDLPRAESSFRRACDLALEEGGERHIGLAAWSSGLAIVLADQGDVEQAKALFTKALQIFSTAGDDATLHHARALRGLAELLTRDNQLDAALETLTQADALVGPLGRAQPANRAVATEMASTALALGNVWEASGLDEQAQASRARALERTSAVLETSQYAADALVQGRALAANNRSHEAQSIFEALFEAGWRTRDVLESANRASSDANR